MIDLGYIIGSSITVVAVTAAALVYRWLARNTHRANFNRWDWDNFERRSAKAGPVIVIVLALAIWGSVTWPAFDLRYQTWEPVSGTVADVGRRMLADGKATEEKVVVRLVEGGEFGCLDTRCTLIKPGDVVDLLCRPVWIYAAPDGYDCRYVSSGAPQ